MLTVHFFFSCVDDLFNKIVYYCSFLSFKGFFLCVCFCMGINCQNNPVALMQECLQTIARKNNKVIKLF